MTEDVATELGDGVPRLFRARHRLGHAREFDAVYAGRLRKGAPGGGLTVFAIPNGLGHCRLGLSIGKRVGGAVRRSEVKRRIREAFRLTQHAWGPGLDLVVGASAHDARPTAWYIEQLSACVEHIQKVVAKRGGTP